MRWRLELRGEWKSLAKADSEGEEWGVFVEAIYALALDKRSGMMEWTRGLARAAKETRSPPV